METTDKTAREIYEDVKAAPARKRFGFGNKAALINIDLQKAYTRTDLFTTAYETNPKQLEYVNQISDLIRKKNWPVIWTFVSYHKSGDDAGVWGTRTNTEDSLQNIKFGSERSELDDRLKIHEDDHIIDKRMPSVFFGTHIEMLLKHFEIDTLLITGGSTSGCVRATAVDSLSRSFRTIVIEECVADKHESYHYANLTDLSLKYADIETVDSVKNWLAQK